MTRLSAALPALLLLAACSGGTDEPAPEEEAPAQPAEPAAPDLSVLFTAGDAAACDWLTETGERVIREDGFSYADAQQLEPVAAEPFAIPGLEQAAAPRIVPPHPGEDRYEVRIDLDGEWLGLDVEGVGYRFLPRTDYPASVMLYLADPVGEVAAALAQAGFPVNADGSMRRIVQDEGGAMYDYYGLVSEIFTEGGETVFTCFETGWDAGD